MIKGIHHVCIWCENDDDRKKVSDFYSDTLGLAVKREWDGGIMYDTGSGLIEVFFNRHDPVRTAGAVQHFALAADDVDSVIEKIRTAGYQITVEPRDAEIQSDPVFPIRVAFCIGPVGETIEIFKER